MRLLLFIMLMVHWSGCVWALSMGRDFELEYALAHYDCDMCCADELYATACVNGVWPGVITRNQPRCCEFKREDVPFRVRTTAVATRALAFSLSPHRR